MRELEKISRDIGSSYSKTTFSEKLNGRSTPNWEFVETFVRACAVHAGTDTGRAELAAWQSAYGRLVEELAAMKDDHREQARSARRAMTKPVAGRPVADFDKKRHTYLDWLRFRYRDHLHMDVLAHGSAPSSLSARGTASLWLPVRETFVPQWVRTRSHETELPREVRQALAAQGRLSEQDIPKDVVREQLNHELRAYADTPVRSVLDVICEPGNRQILMLGAPGAGKSTLAIYVTVSLADLADSNGPKADGHPLASLTGYLPLFLDLRTYQAGAGSTPEAQGGSEEATPLAVKAIFRGISHQGLSSRVLEPYLAGGGKALVIFDGLDEVFDKNQRDLIKWGIAYFADRYKGVRVLVTCRSVGYESEVSWFVAHGFESLVIQDLDREQQIPEFVRRFYHVAYPNHPDQAMALADASIARYGIPRLSKSSQATRCSSPRSHCSAAACRCRTSAAPCSST